MIFLVPWMHTLEQSFLKYEHSHPIIIMSIVFMLTQLEIYTMKYNLHEYLQQL